MEHRPSLRLAASGLTVRRGETGLGTSASKFNDAESEPMSRAAPRFPQDFKSEDGQAIVEYALLLALVTVVTVGTLSAVGEQVAFSLLDTVADALADVLAGL